MKNPKSNLSKSIFLKLLLIPVIFLAYFAIITFQLSQVKLGFLNSDLQRNKVSDVVSSDKDFKIYALLRTLDEVDDSKFGIDELKNKYVDISRIQKDIEVIENSREGSNPNEVENPDVQKEIDKLNKLLQSDPIEIASKETIVVEIAYVHGDLTIKEIKDLETKKEAIKKIFKAQTDLPGGQHKPIFNAKNKVLEIDTSYRGAKFIGAMPQRVSIVGNGTDYRNVLIAGQIGSDFEISDTIQAYYINSLHWVNDDVLMTAGDVEFSTDFVDCVNNTPAIEKTLISLLYSWPQFVACRKTYDYESYSIHTLKDLEFDINTSGRAKTKEEIREEDFNRQKDEVEKFRKLYSNGNQFFTKENLINTELYNNIVLINPETKEWVNIGYGFYIMVQK
jgi:hypothetical protein